MDELVVEVGVKESFKDKWVRSRLKWAVERMGDEINCKKSRCPESGGKRRQGRPRMRWEDSVKRDLERSEENGEQQQKIGVGDC